MRGNLAWHDKKKYATGLRNVTNADMRKQPEQEKRKYSNNENRKQEITKQHKKKRKITKKRKNKTRQTQKYKDENRQDSNKIKGDALV